MCFQLGNDISRFAGETAGSWWFYEGFHGLIETPAALVEASLINTSHSALPVRLHHQLKHLIKDDA